MPLKLAPPDRKHPTYRVRGTYLGVRVDRSTGAREKKVAAQLLAKWKADIERGAYAKPQDPTFASAALSYMNSGGERTFMEPLLKHFGTQLLHTLKQADIDAAAVALYPASTPATRNRQVYTPVSAVLRHAGVTIALRRPKGAQGTPRLAWLSPDEAFALIAAAKDMHPRFGALCLFLLYTGCRLGEALRVRPQDLELQHGFAWVGKTKNGDPRPVHLPPQVVAELANLDFVRGCSGVERHGEARSPRNAQSGGQTPEVRCDPDQTDPSRLPDDLTRLARARSVFGFAKSGSLYNLLNKSAEKAQISITNRVAFHIFRHTYGAWMRRYAGMDTSGLVGTGAWKSRAAASVYEHVDTSEEARKADLLPTWRAK